ncbi:hypothetical protein ACLB1Q_05125 [Escherichia coli]
MIRAEQRRPFPSAWTVRKEALTALSSLHCSMRQRLDHLLLRIGVTVSVDEVHRIESGMTPDHRCRRPDSADLPPSR